VVLRALTLLALAAVPAATARTHGGTPVYFAAVPELHALIELDSGGAVLGRIHVAGRPQYVAAAYPGGRAVVLAAGTGGVAIVDARTRRALATLRFVSAPRSLDVVNPVRAYVVDSARGNLAVVDIGTPRKLGRLHVGARPVAIAFASVGVLWVVHESGPVTVDGRPVRGTAGARDVAATRDGAAWIALRERVVRIARGRRRTIAVRATQLVPDDASAGVFAVEPARGRIVFLSPAGRIVHAYRGCPGARAVAPVGGASVVAACRVGVAIYGRAGGAPSIVRLGAAPSGVAVAVL
jgi:hypothetical protein